MIAAITMQMIANDNYGQQCVRCIASVEKIINGKANKTLDRKTAC